MAKVKYKKSLDGMNRMVVKVNQNSRPSLGMTEVKGEIYYLNDHVQPFKTGAVRMGFEALQDLRRMNPGAAVYILPVALKYSYSNSIRGALKQRLRQLEKKIDLKPHTQEIQTRLTLLMKHVVERYDMKTTSRNIASNWSKISEDISAWRT